MTRETGKQVLEGVGGRIIRGKKSGVQLLGKGRNGMRSGVKEVLRPTPEPPLFSPVKWR